MKNICNFLLLSVIISMSNIVIAVPGEVLNLIANHKEYTGALTILVMGIISCIIGAFALREFKERIK